MCLWRGGTKPPVTQTPASSSNVIWVERASVINNLRCVGLMGRKCGWIFGRRGPGVIGGDLAVGDIENYSSVTHGSIISYIPARLAPQVALSSSLTSPLCRIYTFVTRHQLRVDV